MSRRRNDAALEFDAIAIEGGLLPAEWLAKVAGLQAPHQSPADYGIPKGLNLRDELGRYWRIAEAHWKDFSVARAAASDHRALTSRFVVNLLREVFGVTDLVLATAPVVIGERSHPLSAVACGGRLPLVIAACTSRLEDRDRAFGDVGRQRSAFGLLQDYLNTADTALWGIASNGLVLRLVRDNYSLTRPAWIEADLERIFTEDRFADFSLLWLLMQASRFGTGEQLPQHCALEAWYAASREQGTRAREQLRGGVEEALLALGQGFLSETSNTGLRKRLANGALTPIGYYQQLLRLVYRLIFLLTIEERGLLHPHDSDPQVVRLYEEGYSLRRLRERARRRRAWDRHADLWHALKPVFAGLATGQPLLALPALGGLFAVDQCPDLDTAQLGNRALLTAVAKLAWMHSDGSLTRINWRDMGPEELGSIYESLLELVPTIIADARRFTFAKGAETKGNARKTSGSYYTPDPLVQELLNSALEPVIQQRISGAADPQAALLSITVCDPACGSGHFLLAAARRLASRLAQLRAQGTPSGDEYRHALRDVVTHCIYGVDLNPMALELARMSLWLEAMTPDKSLGFLDHHLQCGNALLGVLDPSILDHGLPDDGFEVLTGDDKKLASEAKKQNKQERESWQRALSTGDLFRAEHLAERTAAIESLTDDDLAAYAAKQNAWQVVRGDTAASRLARLADLYVGAFLLPKTDDQKASLPSSKHLWAVANNELDPSLARVESATRAACAQARVLHWWVAFPHIAQQGGFAVMLGNPPWEVSQLGEEEFFSARAPDIAALAGERRKRAIAALEHDSPRLWKEYQEEKRRYDAANLFYRAGGRYPLAAVGKINTYRLFAETFLRGVADIGRAGFIVPTGIATDDTAKDYFSHLAVSRRLASLFDFENRESAFPAVDSRQKFCLLTIGQAEAARFVCFATQVEHLVDVRRHFTLNPEEFALLNPNTRTCPVFRSERDAELTKKFYRQSPALIREAVTNAVGEIVQAEVNPWGIRFSQGLFNMTSDSALFIDPKPPALPLYEAKMIHQLDHRWATFIPTHDVEPADWPSRDCTTEEHSNPDYRPATRYFVNENEVLAQIARVPRAIANAWLDVHKATELPARDAARQALWLALAAWIAGELFRRVAGQPQADGSFSDGQKLRAAPEVDRRLGTDYPGCAAALREAKITRKKAVTEFAKWAQQDADVPLSDDELATLKSISARAPGEARERVLDAELDVWMDRRSPRWLMGWRDITNATNERTVIASAIPRVGVGHTMPLWFSMESARKQAALLGCLNSLVLDYVARQKVGGTHLTYGYLKQFPILPPDGYSQADLDFIVPRVLELTYTAKNLAAWAADLGYNGAPFPWNPDRRAHLRAELDAYYAHLYGLDESELRYILDPADVMGEDYPSETFRVLRNSELRQYGEFRDSSAPSLRLVAQGGDRVRDYVHYRTQHLVLNAFRQVAAAASVPVPARAEPPRRVVALSSLADHALERPRQNDHAEVGALMVAVLKALDRPLPARQVRLAAVFALTPRLLTPLLDAGQASEWRRLVGDEAVPLVGNVAGLASSASGHWGASVRFAQTNGYLLEDTGAGTWAPGAGLDAFPTGGWPDGRAQVVLSFVQQQAQNLDGLIRQLPADAEEWIHAAA
jgi:N-6 DNA Methylase